MTENQTRNYKKCYPNISLDKNEIKNTENEATALGFFNLKDFPELKTSRQSFENAHSQSSNRKIRSEKSWLTVVREGSDKNFKETFPTLPSLENNKENACSLSSKKNCGKLQPFVRYDSPVAEESVASEGKIVQSSVNSNECKFKSSKKLIIQQQRNPHKKKRSDPIFFNFQDIFQVYKPLRKPRKQIVVKNRLQQHDHKEVLSGNYLDSSNPVRSRGKHREIKKKKMTKLKLAIIRERIIKQKIKESPVIPYFTGNYCFHLIENLDLKVEIKEYLDQLNKKKKEKTENIQKLSNKSLKPNKSDEQAQEIKNIKAVKNEENSESLVDNVKEKKVPLISVEGEIKFSTKFREYCDNILTPALNTAVSELIRDLVKLQDRQFARDPIKAKAKKRHVSGLREVRKYLTLKKVKLIIIAPNLEKVQLEGGVYDSINELKSMADDQNVPYGFALDRYVLGKCTKKNVPVSAFAVLNFEGIEASFENTLHYLNAAKENFLELMNSNSKKVEDLGKEDVNARVISSLISAFREGLQMSNETDQQKLSTENAIVKHETTKFESE